MLKCLANIISISRIALLIALFFLLNNSLLFFIVYVICGLTDVLDGFIARRTNTQSALGARLDSFADLVLFAVITVSIVLWLGKGVRIFLPWIVVTALIRCANLVIAAYKYRSFAILHTLGNKATGFLLFLSPLFIVLQQFRILWVVCIVAVLSAIEETLIHITSEDLNLDRRSIFKP